MSALDAILDAPAEQGRYWVVIKDDDSEVCIIPLCLDGSESPAVAAKRFGDACAVSKQELAKKHDYFPCNYHVDGRPRTDFELATQAYLRKMTECGWDNQASAQAEFDKMVAVRPAKDDPYWASGEIA